MKRHYTFFSLAVISIFTLQTFYLRSIYENYIALEKRYIDECIDQSIDLEYHYRTIHNKKKIVYNRVYMPINDMSPKMRDSLLAIRPLPPTPTDISVPVYNILKLINDRVIKSAEEIGKHVVQDRGYEDNNPINLHILDSLFDDRLGYSNENRIEITNKEKTRLRSIGEKQDYNYSSRRIQIGFKGYQYVEMGVSIPLSYFIKQSLWILILSGIVISIPLFSLLHLVTTIRSRQQLLERREQSINGIIHDLKSPLGAIITMLSLFRMTEKDAKRRELIKTNSIGAQRLITKIESLLKVARYNKGHIIVSKKQTNASQLVENAENLKKVLQLSYNNKETTIRIEDNIKSDTILFIDNTHYDTIISNLLDNALKYSDNIVTITISLHIDTNDKLVIVVEDNGYGIGTKHLKHIFKQFYQAHCKDIKGYGIGLSYLRAVAIAHGGNATVESREGEGSKFKVTLNKNKDE